MMKNRYPNYKRQICVADAVVVGVSVKKTTSTVLESIRRAAEETIRNVEGLF